MHRHLTIILITFLLVCNVTQRSEVAAGSLRKGIQLLQDQQTNEAPPPDASTGIAEPGEETATVTDEPYTDEENDQPVFSEIITAPDRSERKIDDAQWSKLTQDEGFRYEESPRPAEAPLKKSNNGWSKMLFSIFSFFASTSGNVLIISILAAIVLFIIIRVIQLKGNIFFSKKDKKIAPGHEDELSDHFVPDDWDKVIRDAAKAGNYRLAVRHGYRYLLSILQEKELIRYQVAKTNYQYGFELAGTPLHKRFLQLTRDYEYAWYGGFHMEQERFEHYYNQVSTLKKELEQKG